MHRGLFGRGGGTDVPAIVVAIVVTVVVTVVMFFTFLAGGEQAGGRYRNA